MPLLKCQYHGWEYDREGDTKRIPDAKSFRPLAPGVLGLRRYHVELVGQLVFVSLATKPTSLDEQLGGQRSYLEDLFSDRWAPLLTVAQEVDANWKVLAENVLEGYHLEEVHKNTFKKFAPAKACHHELFERVTTYTEESLEENRRIQQQADFFARLMDVKAEHEYHHIFCYPNFAASRMTLFNWVQTILPVAPGKVCELLADIPVTWTFSYAMGSFCCSDYWETRTKVLQRGDARRWCCDAWGSGWNGSRRPAKWRSDFSSRGTHFSLSTIRFTKNEAVGIRCSRT